MASRLTNIRKPAQTFYIQRNDLFKISIFNDCYTSDIILETILAFCAFAFVASITPGPTNFLILSTSSQFGIRKSFPLICGASLGAALLVFITGLGVGDRINDYPIAKLVLSCMGGIWLSFVAWKIFSAIPHIETDIHHKKQKSGFFSGFFLQLVNPKTWLMAIAVITVYTSHAQHYNEVLLILSSLFMLISLPCLFTWACFGQMTKKILSSTSQVIIFNRVLGIILLLSVWYPILHTVFN